jgi:hypothetical protein
LKRSNDFTIEEISQKRDLHMKYESHTTYHSKCFGLNQTFDKPKKREDHKVNNFATPTKVL